MNMLIDAFLVVIFLFLTVKFYKIGILGTFFGVCRIGLSVAASYLLGEYASRFIISSVSNNREYHAVESALALVFSYILVFAIVFLVLTVVISATRRSEPRFIYKIDRFMGAFLGIMLGLCATSLVSGLLYSGLEIVYSISNLEGVMSIYNDSLVFKTVFELSIFDYVRNLIY